MLLTYVDESGCAGDFALGALMVTELQCATISDGLNQVNAYATQFGVPPNTEFHGYDMFHTKGAWQPLAGKHRAMIGITNKVLDVVIQAAPVLFIKSISRPRLQERQDREQYPHRQTPEEVCWRFLLQQANNVAVFRQAKTLVIGDEIPEDERRRRDDYNRWRVRGTPGQYMRTTLSNILDTPLFAPSHESRLIQAIDVCIFHYMRAKRGEDNHPAAQRAIFGMRDKLDMAGMYYHSWP